MSAPIITVDNLGKRYRIDHRVDRQRYATLRDTIAEGTKRLFRSRLSGTSGSGSDSPSSTEEFWALRHLSFEIGRGEVVGIIGRNGAGKSTLLKILSRITEPSTGRVHLRGRVASLLEVGTGFHPELTGRENVFLNGAILGMTRAEIKRKFDEIVAFAEVERFLDTPVKRYSSGMYVRLAFAVAAHLEPEILIVDEVLAVGDIQFQQKCLGRMATIANEGRTVLFVSHNLASITCLCSRALLLAGGELVHQGDVQAVITRYLSSGVRRLTKATFAALSGKQVAIRAISLTTHTGAAAATVQNGASLTFDLEVEAFTRTSGVMCVILIKTETGTPVLHLMTSPRMNITLEGRAVIKCRLGSCQLYPGSYSISLWLGQGPYLELDRQTDVLTLTVEPGRLAAYGFDVTWKHGLVHVDGEWRVEHMQATTSAPVQR